MLIIANNKKKNNKNKIKGVIYGKNMKNKNIEFNEKREYYENLEENKKINIKILNKNFELLIKKIQKHPFKKKIIHIDFYKNE